MRYGGNEKKTFKTHFLHENEKGIVGLQYYSHSDAMRLFQFHIPINFGMYR